MTGQNSTWLEIQMPSKYSVGKKMPAFLHVHIKIKMTQTFRDERHVNIIRKWTFCLLTTCSVHPHLVVFYIVYYKPALRGIPPYVSMRSPGFMFSVAMMYRFLSPDAATAMLADLHGSYLTSVILSVNGSPSTGPDRTKSTHLYLCLWPPPTPCVCTLPNEGQNHYIRSQTYLIIHGNITQNVSLNYTIRGLVDITMYCQLQHILFKQKKQIKTCKATF